MSPAVKATSQKSHVPLLLTPHPVDQNLVTQQHAAVTKARQGRLHFQQPRTQRNTRSSTAKEEGESSSVGTTSCPLTQV